MGKVKLRLFLAFITAMIAIATAAGSRAAGRSGDTSDPTSVTRAYLRAVYARDFAEAYRYVSAEDRRARNLNQYLRQRGPFNGFALEVARMLAAMVEVKTTQT